MPLTIKERNEKQYAKNKQNSFPCPDCGKLTNKTTIYQHRKTIFHKYKVYENAAELASAAKPAQPTESAEAIAE